VSQVSYDATAKDGTVDKGILLEGEVWSSVFIDCNVTTDAGIAYENLSNGQQSHFFGCNANTANGSTAVYIDQRGCRWDGGQVGGASGYGFVINAPEVVAADIDFEGVGSAFKLGDGSAATDSVIRSPVFYDVDDEYVRWTSDGNDATLKMPRSATGSNNAVEEYVFEQNVRRPKIVAGLRTAVATTGLLDNGATNPTVDLVDGVQDDTQRGSIGVKAPGTRVFNAADGNLNIWTGNDWILPDGTLA
jgi:hypothetical protein